MWLTTAGNQGACNQRACLCDAFCEESGLLGGGAGSGWALPCCPSAVAAGWQCCAVRGGWLGAQVGAEEGCSACSECAQRVSDLNAHLDYKRVSRVGRTGWWAPSAPAPGHRGSHSVGWTNWRATNAWCTPSPAPAAQGQPIQGAGQTKRALAQIAPPSTGCTGAAHPKSWIDKPGLSPHCNINNWLYRGSPIKELDRLAGPRLTVHHQVSAAQGQRIRCPGAEG